MDDPRRAIDRPLAGVSAVRADLPPSELDSINITLNRYALGTDMADGEMLRSTFIEEGVLVGTIGDAQPFLSVHGSAEIASYVVETRRHHNYSERHLLTNVSAQSLSPASARVQAYFLVTRIDGSSIVNSATGYYVAQMVAGEDKVWRIERIDVHMDTALQ